MWNRQEADPKYQTFYLDKILAPGLDECVAAHPHAVLNECVAVHTPGLDACVAVHTHAVRRAPRACAAACTLVTPVQRCIVAATPVTWQTPICITSAVRQTR